MKDGGSGSTIRDAAMKVRWQMSVAKYLANFGAEVNRHCTSMNMLLST
jgi:hypothetical protein